ncbi:MAG: protein SCO1/2 [Candidatus Azotimanducaceae bacterium]
MALTETQTQTPEQKDGIRNTLIMLVGFMSLMLGLLLYTAFKPRGLSESEYYKLGYFGYEPARAISEFKLINHKNEEVGLEELTGNWSLIFFGFTYCPDICPTTMGVLNRAVSKMKKKPQVIMVSVDPDRDTPLLLAQYVPNFNSDFVGYTGEFDELVRLSTQLNAAFAKVPGKEPGSYTVDHTASIAVINPRGEYQGFIKSPHLAGNITQIFDSLMQ